MVGNHAQEDMEAAAAIGMPGFLVTDWLIGNGKPVDCLRGTFGELVEFLAG